MKISHSSFEVSDGIGRDINLPPTRAGRNMNSLYFVLSVWKRTRKIQNYKQQESIITRWRNNLEEMNKPHYSEYLKCLKATIKELTLLSRQNGFNLSMLNTFQQHTWASVMAFIQYFESLVLLPGTPCFALLLLTEKQKETFTETKNNEFLIARIYTDLSH